MVDPNTDDATIVERGLDVTRTRLGGHLDQLRNRMTPGQVLDDVVRYFRGKEGAEFGRSLINSVKQNPLPTAVTGIGLAWLMATNGRTAMGSSAASMGSSSQNPDDVDASSLGRRGEVEATRARVQLVDQNVIRQEDEPDHVYLRRREDARGYAIGVARQPDDTHESFATRIRIALPESSQGTKDSLGSAAASVGNTVNSFGTTMQTVVFDRVDRAGTAVSAGSQSAGQAASRWAASLADSPALMGALSLAAGALLGALLPQSEAEEAALNGVAGTVRAMATTLAHDGLDKGSDIANSVIDAGTSSLHAHGLAGEKTPGALVDAAISGDLASDAKQVAEDVLRAGDDAVRHSLPERTDPSSTLKPTS